MRLLKSTGQNILRIPIEILLEDFAVPTSTEVPAIVADLNDGVDTAGILTYLAHDYRYLDLSMNLTNDPALADPLANNWYLENGEYLLKITGFRDILVSVELPILDQNKFYYN